MQFNPDKRMTMQELLEHKLCKQFRKPDQEIQCKGPITTILDDNKKQTVDKYRLMIYGKKNSLANITNYKSKDLNSMTSSCGNKNLYKNNS